MHSIVINKVECRLIGQEDFSTLNIVPQSAVLTEDTEDTPQGVLHKKSVQFDIAAVDVAEAVMKSLRNRRTQFRLTDTGNQTHLVGDDYYFARMRYQKIIDRSPGSFNGYKCTVSCNSAEV
jgi:hypothetical protein